MMREPADPFNIADNAEPQKNATNPSFQKLETEKYLGEGGVKPEAVTEPTKKISGIKKEIEGLQENGKNDQRTKDRIEWLKGMLKAEEDSSFR